MKKIPCSYHDCSGRRAHWCRPYERRKHQMIEVKDDYEGPAWCSFECAAYDGCFSVREGYKHDKIKEKYNWPPVGLGDKNV